MKTQSPSQKGGGVPPSNFSARLLWPNGWINQDATWHEGRSQTSNSVLDGDPALVPTKGVWSPSPIFSPFLLWPNGWMHQDATWYGGRPQTRDFALHGVTSPCPKRGGGRGATKFRPVSIAAKRLHGSKWHLVRR